MRSITAITAFALACIPLILSACATPEKPPAKPVVNSESATPSTSQQTQSSQARQLGFKVASGTYRCELGKKVDIQRDAGNPNLMKLSWQGSQYSLQRYDSSSGLPRFEDKRSGLVWLDLPWKGVLMDSKSGHPLANECKVNG